MKKMIFASMIYVLLGCTSETGVKKDYPIQPVPFTKVKLTEGFWYDRTEINRKVTIPYNFRKCEETGRISNFAKAGGLEKGEFEGIYFNDSDVFKVIEGASYSLQIHPDPELKKYLDDLIVKITAAQEEDGYLYTNRTINPENAADSAGNERWTNLKWYHELYNVGHMYEAAVAHYQATGKKTFLDVAIKNANLVDEVFGPGKNMGVPGHEEIEIGLVKLFRITGDEKYLNLAKFFIDQRGNTEGHELYGEYAQDHKPVVEQDEAVGHSVRAGYLYSGVADVAALTGDIEYVKAIDRIWENVVSKKIYLTGGIGASRHGEAFSQNYDLPNTTAYTETCAAIANMMWNHRLFLLKGESKYMDVFERILYNGFLAGISMEGNTFFYPNPLEFDGKYAFNQGALGRSPWFNCSCCPVNIVRTIPSIPGYIYGIRKNEVFINLFINSKTTLEIKEEILEIEQNTNYPWNGKVKFTISTPKKLSATFKIRIPGWARNQVLQSDLYTYYNEKEENIKIKLNGEEADFPLEEGYIILRRRWQNGDIIELDIPMSVRKVLSHEKVEGNRGKLALERGPFVYCAEAIDNNGKVLNLLFEKDAEFSSEYSHDMLNGVTIIKGSSRVLRDFTQDINDWKEQEFKAVPYYAWAHRGVGEMAVWLPYDKTVFNINPHFAYKKYVKLESGTSSKYGGRTLLTDGRKAKPEFLHQWVGFEGNDMIAVINLGKKRAVNSISVGFLQKTEYCIFMPSVVEITLSENGKKYYGSVTIENDIPERKEGSIIKYFTQKYDAENARVIKIWARNIKKCPGWHPGAGDKAWILADEIIVE
jgi:DUF1680 family protein